MFRELPAKLPSIPTFVPPVIFVEEKVPPEIVRLPPVTHPTTRPTFVLPDPEIIIVTETFIKLTEAPDPPINPTLELQF